MVEPKRANIFLCIVTTGLLAGGICFNGEAPCVGRRLNDQIPIVSLSADSETGWRWCLTHNDRQGWIPTNTVEDC